MRTPDRLVPQSLLRQLHPLLYAADRAREKIWVPFLQRQCACDADTIVIGHSSGAVACMRLLESTRLRGAVLVSACHTDLGDAGERAAGYYSRPWQVSRPKLVPIGRSVHQSSRMSVRSPGYAYCLCCACSGARSEPTPTG